MKVSKLKMATKMFGFLISTTSKAAFGSSLSKHYSDIFINTIQVMLSDASSRSKALEELFEGIDDSPISISPSPLSYGNVSLYELFVLCSIMTNIKANRIFEIGTYEGNSTYHLALNSDPKAQIFTLDLPKELLTKQSDSKIVKEYEKGIIAGRRFSGNSLESKIIQLWGDSTNFNFSPYKQSIDMVFIDGDHSYDTVKSDTRNALMMLSHEPNKKTCIIWHDYIIGYEVAKALTEEIPEHIKIKGTNMAIYIAG